MKIADKIFTGYTYVMAIINLTPDSFWHASRNTEYTVLKTAEKAVADGAAVLDLGAQSTRPGHTEVSAEEELERLLKPLELIKRNFEIPVSVDTYYVKTAAAALDCGADMINDVWGLSYESGMAEIIAKHKAAACIMHNANQQLNGDIWAPIFSFLGAAAEKAVAAGVDRDKIILDGGIGFAKNRAQNHELLQGYGRLHSLGYPLLLGASRKSMFGGNVEDRLEPTLESTRLAAKEKVLFVRVHDVKENVQAVREVYEN